LAVAALWSSAVSLFTTRAPLIACHIVPEAGDGLADREAPDSERCADLLLSESQVL